jgi:hypothetical protein
MGYLLPLLADRASSLALASCLLACWQLAGLSPHLLLLACLTACLLIRQLDAA